MMRMILAVLLATMSSWFWTVPSHSANSEDGPVTDESPEALFQSASLQFHTHGDIDWAIKDLERIIQRHPSYPKRKEAMMMLAEAQLQKGRPTETIRIALEILTSSSHSSEKTKARILLGRSYWVTGKATELDLIGKELSNPKDALPLVKAQGLLFQSEGAFRARSDLVSKRHLDQAVILIKSLKSSDPGVKQAFANVESLKLQHRQARCLNASKLKPTDEKAYQALFQETGQCLLENLISFHSVIEWDRDGIASQTWKTLSTGYESFLEWARDPPISSSDKTRSTQQSLFLKSELRDLIRPEAVRVIDESIRLLLHWNQTAPLFQKPLLDEARTGIEALRKSKL